MNDNKPKHRMTFNDAWKLYSKEKREFEQYRESVDCDESSLNNQIQELKEKIKFLELEDDIKKRQIEHWKEQHDIEWNKVKMYQSKYNDYLVSEFDSKLH